MPSSLNSDNGVVSGTAGLKSSADNSGVLDLQTNGTTAISISASQVVTFANQPAYTGGTANGVLYLNASKVLTSGSSFSYDGAGVLTLGNDSVATVFNAVGDVAQYVVDSNGTGSSASHQWRYGSTEAMRLTSTGLGIGTNSPAYKLDVAGTLRSTGIAYLGDSTTTLIASIGNSASSGVKIVQFQRASGTGDNVNIQGINTGIGAADFGMQVSGGNVGIGLTNPTFQLQLSGGTTVATRIQLNRGSDDTAQNLRLGWNSIKTTRTSNALSTAQTNLDFVQVGSDGERTCFSMGTNGSLEVNFGIKFPATQVASADANTLDDYEEGTWTPTLTFSGGAGSLTYSIQNGNYVKVGSLVNVQAIIVVSNKGSASGDMGIVLPFTARSGTYYGATSLTWNFITYSANSYIISAQVGNGSANMFFYNEPSGATKTSLAASQCGSNFEIIFTTSYQTA